MRKTTMYLLPRNFLPERNIIPEQFSNEILRRASRRLFAGVPTVARIEITNRCNLACRRCLHQSLKEIGDMGLKTYKKIIDILPKSIGHVNPTGFGEPLLHESIIEMVRFAKSKHKYTDIYTNATILDSGMSKNILASGLGSLHFSIDGATKEVCVFAFGCQV